MNSKTEGSLVMTTSREQLIEAITAQLQPPLVPPKEGVLVIGIQPYVVDRVLNALSDLGAVLLMPTKVAEIPEGSTVHLCPPTVSLNWPEGEYKPEIPVDRLVAYVNDQEGGNWMGRVATATALQALACEGSPAASRRDQR